MTKQMTILAIILLILDVSGTAFSFYYELYIYVFMGIITASMLLALMAIFGTRNIFR